MSEFIPVQYDHIIYDSQNSLLKYVESLRAQLEAAKGQGEPVFFALRDKNGICSWYSPSRYPCRQEQLDFYNSGMKDDAPFENVELFLTHTPTEKVAMNAISHEAFMARQAIEQAVCEYGTPAAVFRPKVFKDGDAWCALYGENIQEGVCGFGKSPALAISEFNHVWWGNTK